MKNVFLSMAFIAAIVLSGCNDQVKTESQTVAQGEGMAIAYTDLSFGVRGNCGMCKRTIEKAAKGVTGVIDADWDVDKKRIDVSYDESKTNEMEIHNAIAASGYDTEKVIGNEDAYNNLPGCCQFDRNQEMNQLNAKETKIHYHDEE